MRDWLASAAATRPDHPFLVTPDATVGFAEAEERVRSGVGALTARGIGPGALVGVWAERTADAVLALLAVPRTGAANLLLDPRLTSSELEELVSGVPLAGVLGNGPELGVEHLGVLEGEPVEGIEPDPSSLHSVVFTSGSSARPKGVRLTWGNLEASADASARHLRHGPGDRWLAVLPLHHVGGLSIVVRSARQATTIVLEPGFDPARVARLLLDGEVSVASLVAAQLQRVLDVEPGPHRHVRAVLVGGGPVPIELLQRAAAAGLPVLPTYGMTETASQVATASLDDALRPSDRLFPVPGAEIGVGADGGIRVRGPMVSPGYLGGPDRPDGSWFVTGDVGEIDAEGALVVHGRADDVIVTGGENVHPAEVEAVLVSHPGVEEVAVVGAADSVWGALVTAVYVGEAAPGELERHARYRLTGYKVPRRWLPVGELPRLPVGKVDRRAVRRMLDG